MSQDGTFTLPIMKTPCFPYHCEPYPLRRGMRFAADATCTALPAQRAWCSAGEQSPRQTGDGHIATNWQPCSIIHLTIA